MFCSRRPGLLLSTIIAIDNLGLHIHNAHSGKMFILIRLKRCCWSVQGTMVWLECKCGSEG
ncbi:hypothetical protein Hanom_Chr05g00409561 [Helianthus anomalus]